MLASADSRDIVGALQNLNGSYDLQVSHYLLILIFKDFSRTIKDPQISF